VGTGLQVFRRVDNKGFLATLVVEKLKERSEMKKAYSRGKSPRKLEGYMQGFQADLAGT
jgi:hypothetical protein